jgi:hypothetical protein
LVAAATVTVRAVFGPFEVGQGVDELMLAIGGDTAAGVLEMIPADIRVFTALPADSATDFALGRPLVGDGLAAGLPTLPLRLGSFELPIGWCASAQERFLGIQLTGPAAQGIDGCVFCKSFGGDYEGS